MKAAATSPHFPFLECLLVSLLLPAAASAWILYLGGGAMSWDTYNHHLYLGAQALHGSRLSYDVFAVGGMSCQYPLGYAPLVALMEAGASGTATFITLAALAGLIGPAMWFIHWRLVPGGRMDDIALRVMGCLLAFSGVLWWKVVSQSSNDMIALVPGLWSVALCTWAPSLGPSRQRQFYAYCAIAGALAGLSVVIKLTMFVAPVAAAVLIVLANLPLSIRVRGLAVFVAGMLVCGMVTGGAWALDSWRACGSPVFPFLQELFSLLPRV